VCALVLLDSGGAGRGRTVWTVSTFDSLGCVCARSCCLDSVEVREGVEQPGLDSTCEGELVVWTTRTAKCIDSAWAEFLRTRIAWARFFCLCVAFQSGPRGALGL
jgi:hypothetical protein